nr:uncharacterized protein LOC111984089 [Quercus suber]
MDRSQSLNAPPYFDGSNYAFWKDAIEIGWTRTEVAKSTRDKATLMAVNANSKVLNVILCGVSLDEFHRISHVKIAKEVWQILETTYEGTKKMKDTKLQMLTTLFEELKKSEDKSFDSFYRKLNEVVIGKFNLGEKTKDSKIVTTIEESKDLDEIKIQELINSLQTYELSLPSQRKSKAFALKTINERLEGQDSSNEDELERDIVYLAKNFRKFLKFKRDGKSFEKGKFSKFKKDKKDFKKKDSRDSSKFEMVKCFECKGHGHVKKKYPTYLKAKGNVFATTLCGSDDLSLLVEELGEHTEVESMGIREESDDEDEGTKELQESYNSLLEKTRKYVRVAKAAIRKMKKSKQDYKSILVRYKETKCEVEALNGELTEAYSKIKFLKLEVIQANAKVERVASKKLDEVLAHQKPFFDKSGIGYSEKSSSSANVSKEMKFVKAKEPMVATPSVENAKVEKKPNGTAQRFLTKSQNPFVVKPKAKGKSLPKPQRSSQVQHFYHHCRVRGHTRPNCYKLHALKKVDSQRLKGQGKGNQNTKQSKWREADFGLGDVIKIIDTITSCLASFS